MGPHPWFHGILEGQKVTAMLPSQFGTTIGKPLGMTKGFMPGWAMVGGSLGEGFCTSSASVGGSDGELDPPNTTSVYLGNSN